MLGLLDLFEDLFPNNNLLRLLADNNKFPTIRRFINSANGVAYTVNKKINCQLSQL